MEGTSFLYTFDDAGAPERHTQQYFEIFGNRAIYKDGWWACAKLDRIPWDVTPATLARFAPGQVRPRERRLGALLPARRLLAGQGPRRPAPGEARRAQGALLGRGGEAQGAAAAGRLLGVLRHPAADADRHQAHVLRGRRERPRRHAAADLRPLLRDHRRPAHPRRRRRGRHRGRGRRDGRLLALRPGRQAQAHLQHAGRRGLPAGVDGAAAHGRRDRPHAVRRRRGPSPAPAAT